MSNLSVVIDDFDAVWAGLSPYKANAPLPINTNAMLPGPSPGQRLQSVAGRRDQVSQFDRVIQHLQLAFRDSFDVPEPFGMLFFVKGFGVFAQE